MPHRAVPFRSGECYHLYNRGNNRARIFFERENYLFFLRRLREHLPADKVEIFAYCLMPNHYHLLVQLLTDDLSDLMQSFGLSYTKAINKSRDRVGSLFQGRFKAILVDRDEYLLHLSRYIHLNPVVGRLVATPADWEFSSYREYVGLRQGTLPRPQAIIAQLGSSDGYRRFVESYAPHALAKISALLLDADE